MASNGFSIQGHAESLRQAKAAFQALPAITAEAMADATFTTASEIARIAKQQLLSNGSIWTRTLYDSIGFNMNMKTGRGRVGIKNVTTRISNDSASKRTFKVKGRVITTTSSSGVSKSRIVRPSKYGHLVEFGGRGGKMAAKPFMIPAAESQKGPYLDRCRHAGKVIERNAAAIGMRGL